MRTRRLGSPDFACAAGSALGGAFILAASTAAGLAWDQALGAALVGAMIGGADGWAFASLRRMSALAALRERAVVRHEESVRGLVEALREASAD